MFEGVCVGGWVGVRACQSACLCMCVCVSVCVSQSLCVWMGGWVGGSVWMGGFVLLFGKETAPVPSMSMASPWITGALYTLTVVANSASDGYCSFECTERDVCVCTRAHTRGVWALTITYNLQFTSVAYINTALYCVSV